MIFVFHIGSRVAHAATPKKGRDAIYPIVGGADGQLPVAAVGLAIGIITAASGL